jgi:SrtB family sortase
LVAELILVPHQTEALEGAKACARSVARALSGAGIKVKEQISICSGRGDLQKAVAAALERSNVVLTLGGLGREQGGLTKTAIAQGLGLPLENHPDCYKAIQEYCRRTGEAFLPGDAALAQVPRGAQVFPSSVGKTPGLVISSASQHIVMLPEEEREALALLREGILPLISGVSPEVTVIRTLRTYGISEDMVRRTLAELMSAPNPKISIEQEGSEVLVRVTGRGPKPQQAAAACTPALRRMVELLGDAAYGLDVESLQAAVVDKLQKKNLGIAVVESGSGGMLTRVLSETGSGGEILRYTVAVDTDRAKWEKLGAPYRLLKKHGGCSEQAAVFLANAARKKSQAEIGVALTVGQGYDRKNPLGLVYIAVCDQSSVYVKKLIVGDGHPEEQDLVLDAALSRALNMIRLFVDYLPGHYMGAIPLEEALNGRTVTDLPGQEDSLSGRTGAKVGFWRKLGRNFIIRKADRPGVKVKKAIFILAMLLFLGSAGYVGKYYYDAWAAKELASKLQDMYTYGEMGDYEIPDDFPKDYQKKFGALYAVNRDVIGFISIPGTQMAYPVVQGPNNEYYLRKNYNKEHSEYGIPFLDYRADVKRPSDNLLIYGHNMKDSQIFGELMNYNIYGKNTGKEGALAYFKEHPVIDFSTVYQDNRYAIFAIIITNAYENQGHVFDYHNFIDASSDADLLNYAYQLQIRSIIDTGVEVEPGDKLITLSTCTYEFSDARFVVVARQLREGEDPDDFGTGAKVNPQPLMPDIWYQLYGGSPPTGLDSRSSVITSPTAAPANPPDLSPAEPVTQPDTPPEEPEPLQEESDSQPAWSETPKESLVSSQPKEEAQPTQSAQPPAPQTQQASEPLPAPQPLTQTQQASEPLSSPQSAASQSQAASAPTSVSSQPAQSQKVQSIEDKYANYVLDEGKKKTKSNQSIEDKYANYVLDEGTGGKSSSSGGSLDEVGELTITVGGRRITGDALDLVSRVVQNEIGSSFHVEAIKAQAVAAYTYITFYNQNGSAPAMLLASKADSRVMDTVAEVLGERVLYKGKPALTTYYATSAGNTTSSKDVWGGHYPYLVSVDSEVDTRVSGYQVTKAMSRNQVSSLLERHLGVDPDDWDPEYWFEILTYADGGYVGNMKICGRSTAANGARITGRYVRENLLGLRSACFEVEYDWDKDRFLFTTYGYGHGVGMSQNGANQYAKDGWDYIDILTHYYPGTEIG